MLRRWWPRKSTAKTGEAGDEGLVDGLRRDEPSAVDALVDRYGAWIHRVAARFLNDPRDAEEVTQDVLLTVVQKIGTFKGEAAFSSWVYRIAANAAYHRLRAKRARPEVAIDSLLPVFDEEGQHARPVVDWSTELTDPAAAREAREALERAIHTLPEEYRVVLVLRDVEELTNEEVAAVLGLSVAAVKSRLHRARLAVRQQVTSLFAPPR
jgi:RNA polymerase sigma-70 factor, ECF subfamily